jgi:uncharacterized protein YceK
MKADVGKWAGIVLLSVLAAGCSSIRARTETPESEWKTYPGVRQDVKEMSEIFRGERLQPAWLNGLVTFMLIVDLPFSSVFDTFALPYDLNYVVNSRSPQVYLGTAKGSLD